MIERKLIKTKKQKDQEQLRKYAEEIVVAVRDNKIK